MEITYPRPEVTRSKPAIRRVVQVVVLGLVLLLLASILVPVSAGGGGSPKTACLSNLKQLSMAASMYAQDFDRLPRFGTWIEDLNPYDKSTQILTCPVLKEQGKRFGYGLNGLLPQQGTDFEDWNDTPLFLETSWLAPNALVYSPISTTRHGGGGSAFFAMVTRSGGTRLTSKDCA
ncbi:hypothetical protein [Fimbriimonas ginsengisoli]|uniref:DUF1559 domain-containing protein n=1 Tax=Fimbriimonas ginsengisoli Gsoil 348 TaxID=661478 RepID=A0A068NPF0_FIMGI|nr:hypothetical protein [Fimbriimonas ginsengisoli]AIE85326.1 hypothetical protein OP10G_1958 [Fimbriimonas ginsengisoli Gsoil 348]